MREPREILLCTGVFFTAFAFLVGASPRTRDKPPEPIPPSQLGNAVVTSPTFHFERKRQGKDWLLRFRFPGLTREHHASCKVNVQAAQTLFEKFGFRKSDKVAAIAASLQAQATRAADEKLHILGFGAPECLAVPNETRAGSGYTCRWIWRDDFPYSAFEVSKNEFDGWYGKERQHLLARAEEDFMIAKGFVYDQRQGWITDYSKLVAQATPILSDCVRAFHEEIGDNPEALMNFFQLMPYLLITDDGMDWTSGGVLVPSSVMIQSEGDCDSKAATFCTLQKGYPRGLVIFRSFRKSGDKKPGHALVGVEAYPSKQKWAKGQKWPIRTLEATFYKDPLQVDNRYYIPCEVSGGPSGRIAYGGVGLMRVGDHFLSRDQFVVIPIR